MSQKKSELGIPFYGRFITYEAVLATLRMYDAQYPQNDYDEWLKKSNYKHAVKFNDRLYPPKHILSVVSEIGTDKFSGGESTNQVFRQLGFLVVEKPTQATQHTYLLTWNPNRFVWTDFDEIIDSIALSCPTHVRWSCGNTQTIAIGDRVFLMMVGQKENNGILGSGWVISSPFEDTHWGAGLTENKALYIEFKPDVLMHPDKDELLNPKIISPEFNWYPQRSGISIPPHVVAELETAWQQHTRILSKVDQVTDAGFNKGIKLFKEGNRVLTSAYYYERDLKARQTCIDHHGTTCCICGFNFGEQWGEIGEGFIHIHHLTPISTKKEEHVINPIEDLKPVCPNCHAMLHRTSPPYSVSELIALRDAMQNGKIQK